MSVSALGPEVFIWDGQKVFYLCNYILTLSSMHANIDTVKIGEEV